VKVWAHSRKGRPKFSAKWLQNLREERRELAAVAEEVIREHAASGPASASSSSSSSSSGSSSSDSSSSSSSSRWASLQCTFHKCLETSRMEGWQEMYKVIDVKRFPSLC
jgi:hypothetical protein